MKRMTSNEYNPCFNCNFYSSCSHIRENFPVCPERARYDRLAAIEDILGKEYDLERLRELVESKKEGRRIPPGYALVKMEFLEELEQQAALRREQE